MRLCDVYRAGKNLDFLEKVFRFLGFLGFKFFLGFLDFSVEKTGHKISTQEEHPIHNSLSVRSFSVKYHETHKSRLKCEI